MNLILKKTAVDGKVMASIDRGGLIAKQNGPMLDRLYLENRRHFAETQNESIRLRHRGVQE